MRVMSSRILLVVVLLGVMSIQGTHQTAGSTVAHAMTAYGNAQIDTGQSEFGGASGLFHGSGDYLSTPDSADWAFGAGDFTIDFWVRWATLPTSYNHQRFYIQYADGGHFVYFDLFNNAGTYRFDFASYGGTSNVYLSNAAVSLSTGVWYHVALVRNGNNVYVYKDGTQVGSAAWTGTVPDLAATVIIGATSDGSSCLNGWLDEFRVSKGIARWTSNFTPPTGAYASDSNAVLLLHMDGTDGSTQFPDAVT
jgi:hypothetical protein